MSESSAEDPATTSAVFTTDSSLPNDSIQYMGTTGPNTETERMRDEEAMEQDSDLPQFETGLQFKDTPTEREPKPFEALSPLEGLDVAGPSGLQQAQVDDSSMTMQRELFKTSAAPRKFPSVSTNGDDEEKCSVCLGGIRDETTLNSCAHRFCFECIQRWLKLTPRCPLCKVDVTYIRHRLPNGRAEKIPMKDIASAAEVERLEAAASRVPLDVENNLIRARVRELEREGELINEQISRLGLPEQLYPRRRQSPRFANAPPPQLTEQQEAIREELRARVRDVVSHRTQLQALREDIANRTRAQVVGDPAFRRLVYEMNLDRRSISRLTQVCPLTSKINRRPFTVQRACGQSEEEEARLLPWLRRELPIVLRPETLARSNNSLNRLAHDVFSFTQNYAIGSSQFANAVRSLGVEPARVEQFTSEYNQFACSNLEMNAHDQNSAYAMRGAMLQLPEQAGPVEVVTVDDDSDEDLIVAAEVRPNPRHLRDMLERFPRRTRDQRGENSEPEVVAVEESDEDQQEEEDGEEGEAEQDIYVHDACRLRLPRGATRRLETNQGSPTRRGLPFVNQIFDRHGFGMRLPPLQLNAQQPMQRQPPAQQVDNGGGPAHVDPFWNQLLNAPLFGGLFGDAARRLHQQVQLQNAQTQGGRQQLGPMFPPVSSPGTLGGLPLPTAAPQANVVNLHDRIQYPAVPRAAVPPPPQHQSPIRAATLSNQLASQRNESGALGTNRLPFHLDRDGLWELVRVRDPRDPNLKVLYKYLGAVLEPRGSPTSNSIYRSSQSNTPVTISDSEEESSGEENEDDVVLLEKDKGERNGSTVMTTEEGEKQNGQEEKPGPSGLSQQNGKDVETDEKKKKKRKEKHSSDSLSARRLRRQHEKCRGDPAKMKDLYKTAIRAEEKLHNEWKKIDKELYEMEKEGRKERDKGTNVQNEKDNRERGRTRRRQPSPRTPPSYSSQELVAKKRKHCEDPRNSLVRNELERDHPSTSCPFSPRSPESKCPEGGRIL